MSPHDNNPLWDKLLLSAPNTTEDERNAMNNLGATVIMISKGTPFWQAGEEMLRTKDGDENSYKSSDEINNIDWSVLNEGARQYNTMLYYKGLIQMRKTFGIFTDVNTSISYTEHGSGILEILFEDGNGGKALVIINPHRASLPFKIEGEWNLIADGNTAGTLIGREGGNITVNGISARVYVNDELIG
jgi:pullulanase